MPRERTIRRFLRFPYRLLAWDDHAAASSMLTLGYSRSDYGQYEEWFVLGKFGGILGIGTMILSVGL